MRIARAPFGLVSGGVGAIRWRSGCTRAAASRQPWHRPQGGAPASRLGAGHPPTAPASRPPVQSNAWANARSEEHTSELQSRLHLVCRLLLEKKKKKKKKRNPRQATVLRERIKWVVAQHFRS